MTGDPTAQRTRPVRESSDRPVRGPIRGSICGWEWVAAAAAFLAVNLASGAFQERIGYHEGRGSDGAVYFGVAAQLSISVRPQAQAPFVYRLGTPWLASLLPGKDLIAHFEAVNTAANAISTALLLLWLGRYVGNARVRVLLVLAFVAQWHAPVRFTHFYPTLVEPWAIAFVLAGLLALERARVQPTALRVGSLALVSCVGVCFREVVLMVPLAFCFAGNPLPIGAAERDGKGLAGLLQRLLPLALATLTLLGVRQLAIQVNDYTFSGQVLRFLDHKPPWRYPLAWLIAFGPALFLVVYDWRRAGRFLADRQHLLVLLAATAALAYVGGSDTERFLFWSAPIVYALIGRAIEHHGAALRSVGLASSLVVAQCVSERVFWATPDFPGEGFESRTPILTPPSTDVPYRDVFAFASVEVASVALLQYLALGVVLLLWLWLRSRRAGA